MENNERYTAGLKVMEELFPQEVRSMMEQMKEVSPDLWNMIVSFGFGDLYTKNTLTLQQREIITITSLITQGAFGQLEVHFRAALRVGLTKEEISQIIIQCAGYVGFPKAVQAMGMAGEIFKEN
ncbi:carboxymuconolactone decarboxylase family protein [Sporosarcina sp. G11-34]|uniref:carboxymuconolactone decarboxylase family protein n=1 Tax=Sporosarcina sp. G11-34 TaxID=2849605 RepID=UPI0022A92388|nr:carboxymuconolactone decarboxylase family protein [Sporosarcina sp. G11-34]MCZ2258589.1 carboxymuconolactone decarboxylase family protein [Sporosarcina sp. G11-34]